MPTRLIARVFNFTVSPFLVMPFAPESFHCGRRRKAGRNAVCMKAHHSSVHILTRRSSVRVRDCTGYPMRVSCWKMADAVKARTKPITNVDTAVRSDIICHQADIAMQLGRPLRWDPL